MPRWRYRTTQEDPAYVVTWLDSAGAIRNFSAGYTFTVTLTNRATGTTAVTKTANITGAATAPNVTVAWAVGELNIAAGTYDLILVATTGGRDSVFRPGDPEAVEIVA